MEQQCPKCGGEMWDNRAKNVLRLKEGKKAMPNFKCKNPECEGVIWPPKSKEPQPVAEYDKASEPTNEPVEEMKPNGMLICNAMNNAAQIYIANPSIGDDTEKKTLLDFWFKTCLELLVEASK